MMVTYLTCQSEPRELVDYLILHPSVLILPHMQMYLYLSAGDLLHIPPHQPGFYRHHPLQLTAREESTQVWPRQGEI